MVLIEQRPRDCLPCKLISGGGLIGAGCYVAYNARNFQKIGKLGMIGFSSGKFIKCLFNMHVFHFN